MSYFSSFWFYFIYFFTKTSLLTINIVWKAGEANVIKVLERDFFLMKISLFKFYEKGLSIEMELLFKSKKKNEIFRKYLTSKERIKQVLLCDHCQTRHKGTNSCGRQYTQRRQRKFNFLDRIKEI